MVIDTTWFGSQNCIILYWDHNQQHLQYWHYAEREHSGLVAKDLQKLRRQKVVCASTTTDPGKIILKAVKSVYPDIPKQRCLVHIQRESLNWLTRKPKDPASKHLVPLIQQLPAIKTKEESIKWLQYYSSWKKRWIDYLYKERGEHSDYSKKPSRILRVVSYLDRAVEGMFCFIENPAIPWNTNGLEGRLSSLKQHYRQHRGMISSLRKSYLAWYITVIVNKCKSPTRNCY
jgi:hypothetical protein